MAENKVGTLEEESLKRKERLKKFKKGKKSDDENQNGEDKFPRPSFRSYKPQDESISEFSLEQTSTDDIENVVKDQLELLKTPVIIEEIDIASLAPRKPDWDLKRDVTKKLDKLERRTQKAIAELIRERLKKNQEDIYQAVTVGPIIGNKDIVND